jgi:hypothetical protein
MWTMFFVRRTANKHFDVSFSDMRMWGPKECLDFYSERLVSSDGKIREPYSKDNRDSNIRKHIGGQSDEFFEVFTYRWNNGYAFTDYKERIQIALGRHAAAKGKDCAAEIAKIESIIKEKNALAAGIEELSQNPDISARLSAMLQNMDVSISDVMGDED